MKVLVRPAPLDDETREVLIQAWTAILRAELARAADVSATGTDRTGADEPAGVQSEAA